MPTGNIPKINVRNSVIECAQSLKKENAGKYQNYGIKDCIASIAATKRAIGLISLAWSVGVAFTS